MSKAPGIDALEVMIQEAVALNGDNWEAVDAAIRARLAGLPKDSIAEIDRELSALVSGGRAALTSRYLQ